MMKKRFWALFLAVMMVVSVLPTSAFAAEGTGTPTTSVSTDADSPVQITKSVQDNEDGTYTIDMEAFVTGSVENTNPEPLDIVLVLDVSGSMDDDITIVTSAEYKHVSNREDAFQTNAFIRLHWMFGDGQYWYSEDGGKTVYPIVAINYEEGLGAVYEYVYETPEGQKTFRTSWDGLVAPSVSTPDNIYYLTSANTTVSKMEALQGAVNAFIADTAAKNASVEDADYQHRISIVKFAGKSKSSVGNDTYTENGYSYNNSQIVKNLTTVDEAGADELTKAVNSLEAAGATSADYGMAHAKTVLADSTRSKVIIFFTDGEPNHGNGFSTQVANDTIDYAKDLKDDGATIYTVGVMAGADPNDTRSNINKYMHAVSSNYPDAESLSNMGTRAEDSDFYKIATTEGGLEAIFGEIAEEMIPAVSANEDSILMDTVSEWFLPVVPENATGVSAALWSAGGTGAEPTWTEDDDCDVTAEISGQEVTVTGFDYSAHPVIETNKGWIGKKLVISFVIEPDMDAEWDEGTNLYPTNVAEEGEEGNAGLVYGENKEELTESPEVAVSAYTVTYTTAGNAPEGYTAPTGGVYLPGAKVEVEDIPEVEGYAFDGWKIDGEDADDFIMPSANVKLTGVWSKSAYTVSYKYTGEVPANAPAVPETVDVTGGETYTVESTPTLNGYIFDGWKKGSEIVTDFEMPYNDVELTGSWSKDNSKPTKYTVKYTIEGVEQGNDTVEVTGTAWVLDDPAQIAIAEGGIPAPENKYEGYMLDSANPAYPAAGTLVDTGSVFTVNYVKDDSQTKDLTYTVVYCEKNATGTTIVKTLDSVQKTVKIWVNDSTYQVTSVEAKTFDGYEKIQDPVLPATVMNGDTLYVVYAKKAGQSTPVVAAYQVEHYKWDAEKGVYALADTEFPLYGEIGKVVTAIAKNYEGYTLNPQAEGFKQTDKVTKPKVVDGQITDMLILKLYYDIDVIGGGEDGDKSDETPDKYQITVNYVSDNTDMGTVSPAKEIITLTDENGKWVETGAAQVRGTATAEDGYAFTKWMYQSITFVGSETLEFTIGNAKGGSTYTFTAYWTPKATPVVPTYAVYKVEHYKQNEVGGEYELVSADTEFPKYEEIGEIVTATPKNYGKNYAVNAQKSKLSGEVVNVTKNEATGEPEYLVLKVYYDMLKPADLKVEKVIHSIVDKDGNAKELVYDENGKLTTMAAIGDKITWAAIVSNLGETPITISITDTLVINGVAQEPANVKVWGNTSITLGGGATNTYLYPIYSYTVKNGDKEIINAITVSGTEDGEPKGTDEAPGVTVEQPSVSIEKKADKTSVKVGDKVTYTITVKNTGNVDLTNVKITDTFLDGGKGAKKTEGTWSVDTLKPGDSIEAKLVYTTVADDISGLKNSAVVETEETGENATAEEVEVNPVPVKPVGPSKPKLNKEDHYAYIVGYPDGLVHPEKNITRAEVSTIFFRMLLDESREDFWSQENWYSDVVNTDWFNNAVSTLSNAGLINGYPDGSFKPNANITRAEFATIAIRFFLEEDVEINENNLSDVKGHWAEANINLAYALNLINGYPDGTFRPDQLITRAEAMTIVNRVLERDPHKDHLLDDMIEWPDNMDKDIWYYAAVQEATNSHEFYRDAEEKHEIWTELLPVRDWAALEREWSQANSSKNPGEVVDINISTPEASDDNLKLN